MGYHVTGLGSFLPFSLFVLVCYTLVHVRMYCIIFKLVGLEVCLIMS